MRRKIAYLLLTSIAILIGFSLPANPAKIVEVGSPPTPKVELVKPLPETTIKAVEAVAIVQPASPPAPPVSAYSGSGDPYLDYIIQKESSGNPFAVNSIGACGLFQALPCSKLGCDLSNIPCQLAWGRNYAISRYGSTLNAYNFWVANRWW